MARSRSKNQGALPLEKPVRVALTNEGREQKAHRMAVVRQAIRAHKRSKKAAVKAEDEAIAELEAEMDELADALIADSELRDQGTLFADPHGPNMVETAQVLGKVAAAAGEMKPSEPHAFEWTWTGGIARDTCKHCGSELGDPVHVSRDASEISTPGEVSANDSIAAAKERVTGGNGGRKGPLARARMRKRPVATRPAKGARA